MEHCNPLCVAPGLRHAHQHNRQPQSRARNLLGWAERAKRCGDGGTPSQTHGRGPKGCPMSLRKGRKALREQVCGMGGRCGFDRLRYRRGIMKTQGWKMHFKGILPSRWLVTKRPTLCYVMFLVSCFFGPQKNDPPTE